jgi:hypothetical protein
VLPRGKSSITVTELPYGVGAERVIAKVKELVTGKKLQGIADVKDLTDRQLGTHLVFEVKAGFNGQAVLGELYRLTPLEESFGINNVALVDGQPRTLGLKDLLQVFLDHRVDVVTRRSRFRLRKAQERAHLVEGLLIALMTSTRWSGSSAPRRTSARPRLAHRPDRADRPAGRLRAGHAAAPGSSRWRSPSCRPSWPSCARRSATSSRCSPTRCCCAA